MASDDTEGGWYGLEFLVIGVFSGDNVDAGQEREALVLANLAAMDGDVGNSDFAIVDGGSRACNKEYLAVGGRN